MYQPSLSFQTLAVGQQGEIGSPLGQRSFSKNLMYFLFLGEDSSRSNSLTLILAISFFSLSIPEVTDYAYYYNNHYYH